MYLFVWRMQTTLTEVRIQAERTVASELQHHAASLGVFEWAGQVISVEGSSEAASSWFGGAVISTSESSPSGASLNITAQGQGIQKILV